MNKNISMNKSFFVLVLIFSMFTLSQSAFADYSKVCEVKIGKKSLEGLEICKKDDTLVIYAGSSSKREIIARTVATICKQETIRTIGDFVPNIHTCIYSGTILEIRDLK